MESDDHVCLCFHVSRRKLVNFMERTAPVVPSQLSECLGAGTGCHWCVPFLAKLFEQWRAGETPDLPVAPAEYARRRATYRATGVRDTDPPSSDLPTPTPAPAGSANLRPRTGSPIPDS